MSKTVLKNYLINIFCGKKNKKYNSRSLLNKDVVQLILDILGYNSLKFGVYKHAYGNSRTNLIVSKIVLKKYLYNIFCGKPKKKSQYDFFRTIYASSNKFFNYICCRKSISRLKKSNSRILLNHYVFQLILDFLGSSEFIKNYYRPLTKDLDLVYSLRDSWDPFPTYLFICNQKKIIKIENYSNKKISNLLEKECLSGGISKYEEYSSPGQWIKYTGYKSFSEGRYSIFFLSHSSPKSGLYPVPGRRGC
jgi:hypothetical protein